MIEITKDSGNSPTPDKANHGPMAAKGFEYRWVEFRETKDNSVSSYKVKLSVPIDVNGEKTAYSLGVKKSKKELAKLGESSYDDSRVPFNKILNNEYENVNAGLKQSNRSDAAEERSAVAAEMHKSIFDIDRGHSALDYAKSMTERSETLDEDGNGTGNMQVNADIPE